MDGKSRMLLAEYHVPADMAMEPPDEVTRLYRLGQAFMQVEVSPSGVQHVRWWYTGSASGRPERTVNQPIITDPTGTPALGLTDDPLSALRECLAFSSRDWSQDADLAWLYGIILGWDDPEEPDADATDDVAARFGWAPAKVARLRALRAAFTAL